MRTNRPAVECGLVGLWQSSFLPLSEVREAEGSLVGIQLARGRRPLDGLVQSRLLEKG